MTNYNVNKFIALMEGDKIINRVVEETTGKEMGDFISGMRPEFKSDEILAVRFEVAYTSDNTPDSTPWFINPVVPLPEEAISEDEFGPILSSEYLPELLLSKRGDILSSYEDFMKEDLETMSDEEKYSAFMEYLEHLEN